MAEPPAGISRVPSRAGPVAAGGSDSTHKTTLLVPATTTGFPEPKAVSTVDESRFSDWPQPGTGLLAGHRPFLSLSLSLSSYPLAPGHNTCHGTHTGVTPCLAYFRPSTLEVVTEKIKLRMAEGFGRGSRFYRRGPGKAWLRKEHLSKDLRRGGE